MSNKTKVGIVIVYTIVVATTAYYLAPQKIKIEKEIVTVEVEKKKQEVSKDKEYEKKTTTKKNADGSSVTETVTKITDKTKTKEQEEKEKASKESETKEITKSSGTTSVSILTGVDVTKPGGLIYGASINRSILGPITIGLFGMSNGVGGCSIGLTF